MVILTGIRENENGELEGFFYHDPASVREDVRMYDQITLAETCERQIEEAVNFRFGAIGRCVKGENRDGHDFVAAALQAKAGAALVSKRPEGVGAEAPLLTVANTQRGLEDLACAARARSDAKIVAVTGSAGKTTTKEMLKLAFGALGKTHVSGASFNNHWGVPFSVASLPREAEYAVFEIGMNHFGEIRGLVPLAKPQIVLITTIAPAHLEFFGNCEAIADAKSEIFEGLVPGGLALLPVDSPYCERLRTRAKQLGVTNILTFGSAACADGRLTHYEETAEGVRIRAEILGKSVEAVIGAPGKHIANNALGNVTLCGQTDWMGNKERPEHDTDRAVDCDTCLSTVALIRNHTI